MGQEVPIEAEIYRDDVAATSKMAYFKPYRAKMGFRTATVSHYVFSGFSENLSIFKNPSSGHVRPRRTTATLIQTRTEGVGRSVIVRNFSWKMPHFQHVAPGRRCIFEGPVALTAALLKPPKHYENRDFLPRTLRAPFFERMTRSILERIGPKKAPKSNTTAYIYIYTVKLLSGPSLGVSGVIIWSKFVF